MVVPFCARPADAAHARAHAATAAAKISLFDEKIEGLFPSMRNPLENSSVAQSLDGVAV
jgi:hypothetical protein